MISDCVTKESKEKDKHRIKSTLNKEEFVLSLPVVLQSARILSTCC